jgi:16S rRNA (guanine527-N7)-methyltransferase
MPLLKKKSKSEVDLPALISLKGGNLEEEIRESRLRPEIISIYELFPEEYFREKYMLITRAK